MLSIIIARFAEIGISYHQDKVHKRSRNNVYHLQMAELYISIYEAATNILKLKDKESISRKKRK